MRRLVAILTGIALALAGCAKAPADQPPLVLAASSLQESLSAAADDWAAAGNQRPVISFAASSALARQIDAGADADLFISADQDWMDNVVRAGRIKADTRRNLAGNALVLIAPLGSRAVTLDAPSMMAAIGSNRLAMADPDSVPAGKYGKAALEKLGLWPAVAPHVARAENVRAALALVERGEAPLGIVYATDARASHKVMIVANFPDASHPPIVYPMAMTATARPSAQGFYRYLLSPRGQAVLARFGFTAPTR